VVAEKNIINDEQCQVTFKYQENKCKQWLIRTEPVAKSPWLVLQHVLPKGFQRARDYGFLHSNANSIGECTCPAHVTLLASMAVLIFT